MCLPSLLWPEVQVCSGMAPDLLSVDIFRVFTPHRSMGFDFFFSLVSHIPKSQDRQHTSDFFQGPLPLLMLKACQLTAVDSGFFTSSSELRAFYSEDTVTSLRLHLSIVPQFLLLLEMISVLQRSNGGNPRASDL